jgi:hypothetical protein
MVKRDIRERRAVLIEWREDDTDGWPSDNTNLSDRTDSLRLGRLRFPWVAGPVIIYPITTGRRRTSWR